MVDTAPLHFRISLVTRSAVGKTITIIVQFFPAVTNDFLFLCLGLRLPFVSVPPTVRSALSPSHPVHGLRPPLTLITRSPLPYAFGCGSCSARSSLPSARRMVSSEGKSE